jgi:hypothetical protein
MRTKLLMRNNRSSSFFVGVIFVTLFVVNAAAQKAGNVSVKESNVRAGMYFLAGDALQGRGSGTIFERIAAEYVGSQFMQFGLEPAGEKGADGKPTFVQTVEVPGREMVSNITIGGAFTKPAVFGTDFVAYSVSAKQISGPLQKLKPGASATRGSIVLLMLGPDDKFDQAAIRKLQQEGAAAIMMAETKESRENWTMVAARRSPVLSRAPFLMSVSTATVAGLDALADGSTIAINAMTAPSAKTYTWNAAGKITGTDPKLSSEVILLSSHLDHLGVRENTPGDDKIFNGADDDASGTVAVIELARVLAAGKKPKRTIYFVAFGSEEAGGHGSRYFADNLPFPQDKFVANLQFEMIGRPDDKVKADELWLTGYERSTLGPELAKRGAKLVLDPRPEQNFFRRSDNYTLAAKGIVAHTVSSFGLHTDYHKVTDENKTIDFEHMTKSINSMVGPINWLVNSDFKPMWNEGMKP